MHCGHQTGSLALLRHFTIPKCPSCNLLKMSDLMFLGINIWEPFKISPLVIENSSLYFQKTEFLFQIFLFMHSLINLHSLSVLCSLLISSSFFHQNMAVH